MPLLPFPVHPMYKTLVECNCADNVSRNIRFLSANQSPIVMDILRSNLDYVFWTILSENPAAILILEENVEHISWRHLCLNPAAIHLLKLNIDRIDWKQLSLNPNGWQILQDYPENIDWDYLSMSCNSAEFMQKHINYLNWDLLSSNHFAIQLLLDAPGKINWDYLSENEAAIDLLKSNNSKINWCHMSLNPAVTEIMKMCPSEYSSTECFMHNKNFFNICGENIWYALSDLAWEKICAHPEVIHKLNKFPRRPSAIGLLSNPNLFTIDYYYLHYSKKELHNELMAELLHPDRVIKYINKQSQHGYVCGCLNNYLM